MRLADEIAGALEELERDTRGPDEVPQWCVFGTLTLPCVPHAITEAVQIDPHGNAQTVDLALHIRLAHFNLPGLDATPFEDADAAIASSQRVPKSGDKIRFRWNNYKVISARIDSSMTYLRLDLAHEYSNR